MADEYSIDAKYKRDSLVAEHERYRRERDEARDRVSLLETSLRDAQDLYDRIKARAERAEARVAELERAYVEYQVLVTKLRRALEDIAGADPDDVLSRSLMSRARRGLASLSPTGGERDR